MLNHEEDVAFCKKGWNDFFDLMEPSRILCIILHDNTNVPLMRPSDPDLQRAMYSSYYAGCVGKGGVSLQLCGWTRTWPLATGAIDDSAYIKLVNVFELQQNLLRMIRHAIIRLPICLIMDIVLFLMDCYMANSSASSQPLRKVIRNLGQIVCFTWWV